MTASTCFPHTPAAPWSRLPRQPPLRPGGVEFHFETPCVRREGQPRACSVAAARWGCCSHGSGRGLQGCLPPTSASPPRPPRRGCGASRRPSGGGSPRSRPPPSAARLAAASHPSLSPPLLRWRSWGSLLFAPHTALPAPARDLRTPPGDQRISAGALSNTTLPEVGSWRSCSAAAQCKALCGERSASLRCACFLVFTLQVRGCPAEQWMRWETAHAPGL